MHATERCEGVKPSLRLCGRPVKGRNYWDPFSGSTVALCRAHAGSKWARACGIRPMVEAQDLPHRSNTRAPVMLLGRLLA
jgi:hypothetical protein